MKKIMIAGLAMLAITLTAAFIQPQASIAGAWTLQEGSNTKTLVIQDGYLSQSTFNIAGKKFHDTRGGVAKIAGNKISLQYEFSIANKDLIGTSEELGFNIENGNLVLTQGGKKETWKRVDNNNGPLAGVWYMSGRVQNGQTSNRAYNAARKTIKIMSGTRFQWVQVNTESKQTGASGGGNYTFVNGKYTENIEFFTRDSSRVGVSLTFDDSVEGNVWTHKGQSSTGQAMHEVWSKVP
jgi:hypothetical protein